MWLAIQGMTQVAGSKEKLVGKLQERYGWERQEAERKADEFLNSYSNA